MTQINLLPWREQQRKEKKIQFGLSVIVFSGLAVFVIVILHLYFASIISFQNKRNAFLQAAIDHSNQEISGLNKKKVDLNVVDSDLRFLFSLRERGYRAVRILDAIESLVPEGVTFTKIVREGDSIVINGVAKSNLEVTKLMKNLDQSPVFKLPDLAGITVDEANGLEKRTFELKIEQEG